MLLSGSIKSTETTSSNTWNSPVWRSELNKVKVSLIRKLLHARSTARAAKALEKTPNADIADLFGDLSPGETDTMVEVLLHGARAGRVLKEIPEDFLPGILEKMDDGQLVRVLSTVPADDGMNFILSVSEERRAPLLSQLTFSQRSAIEQILTYPEDSAGRLMSKEFLAYPIHQTAEDTIEFIRQRDETYDTLYHIYVVDEGNHLLGYIPLRRLVAARKGRTLGEIMVQNPVAVSALADQEEAARLVARHNLMALPAVDDHHQLVGVITVDDIIEVIQEEATEDMYRLAGLGEGDRVFSTTTESVKRRIPWNIMNMLTAFIAAAVVGMYEDVIAEYVVLATFMPVVAGMGGNTGIQTLTVVTRGIALGEIQFSTGLRAIGKEVSVGLSIGIVMGILTAGVAFLWKGDPTLGLVLVLAMILNMTLAGLLGAAIPIGLKFLKQDPALGGGVILTAFTDSLGFFTFLGLGALLMGQLMG